jgi:hypothetical protein
MNVAGPKGKSIRSSVLRRHCHVLSADGGDSVSDRLDVDRSADLVGDAFARIRAPYRRKRRYLVEELCDIGTRARRLGHRARPAREHHEVEVGGAESVAEEQDPVTTGSDSGDRCPLCWPGCGVAAIDISEAPPLALHLHDLIHRHHVVVEVGHDPERSGHHENDDQDTESQRQHVIGVVGPGGDVQEEH